MITSLRQVTPLDKKILQEWDLDLDLEFVEEDVNHIDPRSYAVGIDIFDALHANTIYYCHYLEEKNGRNWSLVGKSGKWFFCLMASD